MKLSCKVIMAKNVFMMNDDTATLFTPALLIWSETGFAPMRAFTLQHLIRINDLIRIKLNHLREVVLHRFSLLRVLIASVEATRTRIKGEQIRRNHCHNVAFVFTVSRDRSIPGPEEVLGCQQYIIISYRLPVKRNPVVIYNIIAM